MVWTCSVYNGTTSWLGINILVIAVAFIGIGLLFMATRFLNENAKAKLTGITKMEVMQTFISLIIIVALAVFANSACGFFQSIAPAAGAATVTSEGSLSCPLATVSASGTDPFSYAESYVGQLAFDIGPNLAVASYSTAFATGVLSGLWTAVGDAVGQILTSAINAALQAIPYFDINFPIGFDIGIAYGLLSDAYIIYLIPLIVVADSVMFVQYVALIAIQSLAFTILLPIAIILRSVSVVASPVRNVANSLIAIAIAMYLVYPLTIAFDAYAINWLYTPCSAGSAPGSCNPSASFICDTYSVQAVQNSCSLSQPPIYEGSGKYYSQSGWSCLESGLESVVGGLGVLVNPTQGLQVQLLTTVNGIAEYVFDALLMFAVNISITVAFAMGLAKAFNNGIEGAATFWSNL